MRGCGRGAFSCHVRTDPAQGLPGVSLDVQVHHFFCHAWQTVIGTAQEVMQDATGAGCSLGRSPYALREGGGGSNLKASMVANDLYDEGIACRGPAVK